MDLSIVAIIAGFGATSAAIVVAVTQALIARRRAAAHTAVFIESSGAKIVIDLDRIEKEDTAKINRAIDALRQSKRLAVALH